MPPASTSPAPPPPHTRARAAALVGLAEQRLRGRLTAQFGTVLVWLIGLGATLLVGLGASSDNLAATDATLRSTLGWLSWLGAGALILSATSAPSADDDAIAQLARWRGFSARALERARWLATGRRVFFSLWPWALLLTAATLAHARSVRAALAQLAIGAGCTIYLGLLAASSVLLVALTRSLSNAHPRLLLMAVVFLPALLAQVFPQLPSLPAVLSAALEHAVALGRRLG